MKLFMCTLARSFRILIRFNYSNYR